MSNRLPALRRTRRRLNVTAVAARLSKGVAKVDATVEPFAQWWDDWNHRALHDDGPLWVALGDSVTQGIGASGPSQSYAIRTLERMRAETDEPWRLINLSMSGGRFEDVVRHQLRAVRDFELEPDVVSVLIGSNDVIWRRDTKAIVNDARAMVTALPEGAVLSRVSGAKRDRRRLGVNEVFSDAEREGRVRLFQAWDWPTGTPMWAEDKFHPNDHAYEHLHENVYRAFQRHGVVR